MKHFILDASALGKRYVPERGTALLNYLFDQVGSARLHCLTLGGLEAVSVIVRARNGGRMSPRDAAEALVNVRLEALPGSMHTIPAGDDLVLPAADLIEAHHVNSTDAVLLRAALILRAAMRAGNDDLVLVSADRRLLKAAAREGLPAFDPETEDLPALEALAAGG